VRLRQASEHIVGTIPFRNEAFARGARMLRTALGPDIAGWLEDPAIVEVPRHGLSEVHNCVASWDVGATKLTVLKRR